MTVLSLSSLKCHSLSTEVTMMVFTSFSLIDSAVFFLPGFFPHIFRNALGRVSLGFLWEFHTCLLDSVFFFHLTRSLFSLTYKSKLNSPEFMGKKSFSKLYLLLLQQTLIYAGYIYEVRFVIWICLSWQKSRLNS